MSVEKLKYSDVVAGRSSDEETGDSPLHSWLRNYQQENEEEAFQKAIKMLCYPYVPTSQQVPV